MEICGNGGPQEMKKDKEGERLVGDNNPTGGIHRGIFKSGFHQLVRDDTHTLLEYI